MSEEAHRLFEPEDEPNIISRSTPTEIPNPPVVPTTGEWTAKTVLKLWQMGGAGCDTNSRMTDIAIAHNAALAAERKLFAFRIIEAQQPLVELLGECRTKLDWSVCDGEFIERIDAEIAKLEPRSTRVKEGK